MPTYQLPQAISGLKTVLERAKRQVQRFETNPIFAVGIFAEGSDHWNRDHLNDPHPVARFLNIPVDHIQLTEGTVHANRDTLHEGPYFVYLRSGETTGNRSVAQEVRTQRDALGQIVQPLLDFVDGLPSDIASRFRRDGTRSWFVTLFDIAIHYPTPLLEATRERWLNITGPAPSCDGHATLPMNYPHECKVHELRMQLRSIEAVYDDVVPGTIWSCLKDDVFSSTVQAIQWMIAELENAILEPAPTDGMAVRRQFAELHQHFSHLARLARGFGNPEWQLVKLATSFRMPAARTWCDFPMDQRYETVRLSQQHADAEYLLVRPMQDEIQALLEEAGNALPPKMFDGPVMFRRNLEWFVLSSGAHLDPNPVAKWVRFVFNSLRGNDPSGDEVCFNYMSVVGRAENPFEDIYGYATLKNGFFAASAKAIELARLLPVGTSITTATPITSSPTADGDTRTERLLQEQAKQSNGNKPEKEEVLKTDGFFDADGFRFAGVEVRFGRAYQQYKLVKALWEEPINSPASPRLVEQVLYDVYGDSHDTTDAAFRQLCSDTRKRFETANCPLLISSVQGKVFLKPVL